MMWNYRVVIIVPANVKAAAEQAARAINSTGPDYTGQAFTVPMSASGEEPPTHYGLYTSATDQMVTAMAAALPRIAGAQFWRHGLSGDLQASNVTSPTGQAWGWTQSLNAAGLSVVSKSL